MAAIIYSLCAFTCLVAFVLLLRGWRATRLRLLFWSGLCFVCMTVNNVVLTLDTAPGGHLGVLTGRAARHTTWRIMEEFIAAHSSDAGRGAARGRASRRSAAPPRSRSTPKRSPRTPTLAISW